jgi:4'-phosphopantetheinyl transferase
MPPTSPSGSAPPGSTVPRCETAVPPTARPSRNAVPPGNTVDVWWFDTRAVAVTRAGLAGLDRGERSRAEAFLFPADRHRYQVAHVMLREVLAGYTGAAPGQLPLDRDPCPRCGAAGKPVLLPVPGLRAVPSFSLAHSGDVVVIAVAGRTVGVDVERDVDRCVCPLAPALHPADTAWVTGLDSEEEQHRAIIDCWVKAEAVLKCTGQGIGHGLDGFPAGPGPAADLSVNGCAVRQLAAPAGYRAAVALAGGEDMAAVCVRKRSCQQSVRHRHRPGPAQAPEIPDRL